MHLLGRLFVVLQELNLKTWRHQLVVRYIVYGTIEFLCTGKKDKNGKKDEHNEHVQPQWMYIGDKFSGQKLISQVTRPANQKPKCTNQAWIPHIDIIEILHNDIAEGWLRIGGLLSTLMAIGTLQFCIAI